MNYTDEQFITAVKISKSIAEVLRILGLGAGGNYRTFHKEVKRLNLSTEHFNAREITNNANKKDVKELLKYDPLSKVCNGALKKRCLAQGILKNECVICKIEPFWQNKPLILQLDHINGNTKDNRLENLRILCPNCHTQTSNFAGKNVSKSWTKKCLGCKELMSDRIKGEKCNFCLKAEIHSLETSNIKDKKTCILCKKPSGINTPLCKNCWGLKNSKTKIKWPSNKELEDLVWKMPVNQLATQLGLSAHTIHKKCKKNGIVKPEKNYWKDFTKPKIVTIKKIIWPEKEELQKLVWEKPSSEIAREFGISDVAIGKRCKKYGIEKPPRGYWAKQQNLNSSVDFGS